VLKTLESVKVPETGLPGSSEDPGAGMPGIVLGQELARTWASSKAMWFT
jgi:hypothetical protein